MKPQSKVPPDGDGVQCSEMAGTLEEKKLRVIWSIYLEWYTL